MEEWKENDFFSPSLSLIVFSLSYESNRILAGRKNQHYRAEVQG